MYNVNYSGRDNRKLILKEYRQVKDVWAGTVLIFPLQYCGNCRNWKDKTSLNFFLLNPEALEGKVFPKDVHLFFAANNTIKTFVPF